MFAKQPRFEDVKQNKLLVGRCVNHLEPEKFYRGTLIFYGKEQKLVALWNVPNPNIAQAKSLYQSQRSEMKNYTPLEPHYPDALPFSEILKQSFPDGLFTSYQVERFHNDRERRFRPMTLRIKKKRSGQIMLEQLCQEVRGCYFSHGTRHLALQLGRPFAYCEYYDEIQNLE